MVQIAYRTLIERPRQGAYGAVMRIISRHPMLAGFLGGIIAILIALTQGWKGATAIPDVALAICGVVLVSWIVLFRLMRGFFASQVTESVEVVRAIFYDGETLRWVRGTTEDELLKEVQDPVWRMVRASGSPAQEGAAWPVFVIAGGHTERFVVESRATWSEARQLAADDHITPDEFLPAHVASPLLELGRSSIRDFFEEE